MPKVTDFPDNRASMLQAVFQSRQADLQADQMYLNSNAQTQQLRQSLFGMMLQDDQHDEQIALGDRQLTEQGRQADNTLTFQRENLAEIIANNKANQDHDKATVQFWKDGLAFQKDQFNTEQAMGVIDAWDQKVSQIANDEAQLASYAMRRQDGFFLTGEEIQDISSIQKRLNTNIGLAHDYIQNIGDVSGIDKDMLGSMTNTLSNYGESTMSTYNFNEDTAEGQGLLFKKEPDALQTAPIGGMISRAIFNTRDTIRRVFSDEAPLLNKLVTNLDRVIEGKDSLTDRNLRQYRQLINTQADQGTFAFERDRRMVTANQIETLPVINNLTNQVVLATLSTEARGLGINPDDPKNPANTARFQRYIHDPVRQAEVIENITPVEIKRGEQVKTQVEDLVKAHRILSSLGFHNIFSNGPRVRDMMEAMGLEMFTATSMTEIRNDIDKKYKYLDPRVKEQVLADIDMLIGFGGVGSNQDIDTE